MKNILSIKTFFYLLEAVSHNDSMFTDKMIDRKIWMKKTNINEKTQLPIYTNRKNILFFQFIILFSFNFDGFLDLINK